MAKALSLGGSSLQTGNLSDLIEAELRAVIASGSCCLHSDRRVDSSRQALAFIDSGSAYRVHFLGG
jgi:hypothetical protein